MPFGGNFHISKVLSNLAINYKNADFIADQAFPSIPVQKESDLYYIYVRDFRVQNTFRANKAPANMVSWGISTAAYYLDEHALADIVTDRDRSNSDLGTIEQDTVEFLTSKILVRKEKAVADLVFTTGSWGLYASGSTSTSWNYNTTTSAPIQNVLSGTMAIVKNSGVSPNTMILGMDIFHSLKENPNVYGRVQYVERSNHRRRPPRGCV